MINLGSYAMLVYPSYTFDFDVRSEAVISEQGTFCT